MIPNVKLSTAQGDTQLGTALESDIDIWADNTSQDLDKDGLNDAWENAALEQLRPTFLYPDGEGLIESPADQVALFTRITPVELETNSGEKATYIAFLNTAAYTQDYGAPDLGNATGGHSGDVSSFRTAWKVLDDDSTIELERLWTSGHVGTLRAHESYAIGVNGASSADSFLGPAEGPPIEFTEDGSMKLYIEEDKHSNWSSIIKHSMEDGSYPIGAKYAIRPDAYNVGEPWHHASSTFYDDIGFLFEGEAIWNDADNRFCGGLECDDAKTGSFLGGLFGSGLGAVVGGMLLGPAGAAAGGAAGGIYGSKFGKEIDGTSPTRLGDRFTDNVIDEFFPNNIRSGGDFYGGLSSDFAEPFILTINQVKTLDNDGLDGEGPFGIDAIDGRGHLFAKVSFESNPETQSSQVQETDDLKGIGIEPNWTFGHVATGATVNFTIQIWDDDSTFQGEGDDQGDINPYKTEKYDEGKTLHLQYNIVDKALYAYGGDGTIPLNRDGSPSTNGVPEAWQIDSDGRFYFQGETKDDGTPKTDQVGIWLSIDAPILDEISSGGTLQPNSLADDIIGNDGDEILIIRHISGDAGSEVIEIGSGSTSTQYEAGSFNLIERFAGGGDDTIILNGVRTAARLGGGNGDDVIEIINTPASGTDNSILEGGDGNDLLRAGSGDDSLHGGRGDDELIGDLGDDYIAGGVGDDTIDAGDGSDIISGDLGTDVINAGDGDDWVSGGDQADIIKAGDGDDIILGDSFFESSNQIAFALPNSDADDVIDGGDGDDTILGEWGDDEINGGNGQDYLLGGDGNDQIDGGDDNDTLEGNNGNDFLDGGSGDDNMTGGTGNDVYIVDSSSDTVVETLTEAEDGGIDRVESSVDFSLVGTQVEDLTLTGTADLEGIGNELENIIIGNSGDNSIYGGTGNDTLFGKAGDDNIFGQAGDDVLNGGEGCDTLNGGAGNDTVSYADADDRLIIRMSEGVMGGAASCDTLVSIENIEGSEHDDRMVGDELDNILSGIGGDDALDGREGDDTLKGGEGDDSLRGDEGNDVLEGGIGRDVLSGGEGDDSLAGGDDYDRLYGDAGNDEISGGALYDDIYGGAGNDIISGDAGDDYVEGGAGDDQISGGAGIDILDGGSGNDSLDGGAGDDDLYAGQGNDVLTGGAGDDRLTGGGGQDVFVFQPGSGTDTITDFTGVGQGASPDPAVVNEFDSLKFEGEAFTARNMLLTQNGSDLEITFAGVNDTKVILENVALENLDNLPIQLADSPAGAGNILFDGQSAIEDAFDVFNADWQVAPNSDQQILNRDTVTFLNDLDNDIQGFDDSDDVINGQGGDDIIQGLSGDDLLRGGASNDTLMGGDGADILVGGEGADQFQFNSVGTGSDRIDDFSAASGDLIALSKSGMNIDLVLGILTDESFTIGSSATRESDRLIYDSTTGSLFYDADGTGADNQQQIAQLAGTPTLSASDLVIVM